MAWRRLSHNGSEGGPAELDQDEKYDSRNESVGREIVPVFVPGERGCLPPRPERQVLRAKTPVVFPGHHV